MKDGNVGGILPEYIDPAADMVKAYLRMHRGEDYLELVDMIAGDLDEYVHEDDDIEGTNEEDGDEDLVDEDWEDEDGDEIGEDWDGPRPDEYDLDGDTPIVDDESDLDPLPPPTLADAIIPAIEHLGIRCRLTLLNDGGGEGLEALINGTEGSIIGEHPELTRTMRLGIVAMLVGPWRIEEVSDGYLVLEGPGIASLSVRLRDFQSPEANLLRALGVQH